MKISSARHLRRKDNLDTLIDEIGGTTALAKLVYGPDRADMKSHISAMQAGTRGLGDQLAAKIEKKCGKPAGWLDIDHSRHKPRLAPVLVEMHAPEEMGAFVSQLLALYAHLDGDSRKALVDYANMLAAGPNERRAERPAPGQDRRHNRGGIRAVDDYETRLPFNGDKPRPPVKKRDTK